jgi:hypothetical protein
MRAGFVFFNAFLAVVGVEVSPWCEAAAALLVKAQPAGVAHSNDLVVHRRVYMSTQGVGGASGLCKRLGGA